MNLKSIKLRSSSFDMIERFLVVQAVVTAGVSLFALFKYQMVWAPVAAFVGALASGAAIFIDGLEARANDQQ